MVVVVAMPGCAGVAAGARAISPLERKEGRTEGRKEGRKMKEERKEGRMKAGWKVKEGRK